MDQHNPNNKSREIEITAEDLPLHCPMPSMMLWNSHPRVFCRLKQREKRYVLTVVRTIPLKAEQLEDITSISSSQY